MRNKQLQTVRIVPEYKRES